MQARPEEGAQVRPCRAERARSKESRAAPRCTSASAMPPSSIARPEGYSFLPELADCSCKQISIETAQSKLDCSRAEDAARQEDHARRHRPLGHDGRDAGDWSPRASAARCPTCRAEEIIVAPDCGMKYLPRDVAFGKLQAMVEGARIVREELQRSPDSRKRVIPVVSRDLDVFARPQVREPYNVTIPGPTVELLDARVKEHGIIDKWIRHGLGKRTCTDREVHNTELLAGRLPVQGSAEPLRRRVQLSTSDGGWTMATERNCRPGCTTRPTCRKDLEATRKFYEDVIGLPLIATWCEKDVLFGAERTYCHCFFGLGDGGALAFFQFADTEDQEQFGPKMPPSPFHHIALQRGRGDAGRHREAAQGGRLRGAEDLSCSSTATAARSTPRTPTA